MKTTVNELKRRRIEKQYETFYTPYYATLSAQKHEKNVECVAKLTVLKGAN